MRYSISAPAKINLFLDVLSKHENGYHDIKSVMQSVSLSDEITISVEKSLKTEINLSGTNKEIAWNESNLAYKACAMFIDEAGLDGFLFNIHVEKKIPIKAGMGGGSADAAATLKLLNDIFDKPFTNERLCQIGARLGADVAFCIIGGTCLCEGFGDKLTPVTSLANVPLVCAIGSSSISTPEAYEMVDRHYGTDCGAGASIYDFLTSIKAEDLNGICSKLYNKFEGVISSVLPEVEHIKDILIKNGAIGALMSGSGPSVFGVFDSEKAQLGAFSALTDAGFDAFLCKTL